MTRKKEIPKMSRKRGSESNNFSLTAVMRKVIRSVNNQACRSDFQNITLQICWSVIEGIVLKTVEMAVA